MAIHYNWENGLFLNPPVSHKTTAEYQGLLDVGDFSKLEDLLMEHLDTTPEDITFYLPAYRAFIRKQDKNRASAFLALHVETLQEHHHRDSEIFLLQTILGFWDDCKYAHNLLLDHLKSLYSDSPNFDRYMKYITISRKASVLEQLHLLEIWLRYDEGRIVYIPSKGVARIRETNPKLGVVRMSLKNGEQMSFRIDEAQRLTQSLANDHFLARIMTDTEVLKQLSVDDPGELLRLFFKSIQREVTLNEMREMLSGIIPDSLWNTWWTRVRKDSRLIVGTGTKPNLNWNDSIAERIEGLLKTFYKVPLPDKLELLKKHASKSEEMALEMARFLVSEAAQMIESDPSFVLEVYLTIEDISPCRNMEMPFKIEALFSPADIGKIISGIGNRIIRRKATQQVIHYRDDWPRIYKGLLNVETDMSLFKLLYESLQNGGSDDILVPEVGRVLSNPSSNPLFYIWICKEALKRPELQKHLNWNFLHTLLGLLDDSTFKNNAVTLRKFFDPGSVVDRAIETIDIQTGRSLLDILSRARGLEDFRKDSVRQKLYILFPELHENQQTHLLVTKEALDGKRIEYEKLIKEDIPRNAREIQRTREYGDLRENFEYHEARRQQELLSSRAKTLHDDLITARAIEPQTVDTSKISIGTRCILQPMADNGETITLTILGPWDSDPANNILSYTSAAGEALLNAKKGSTVSFNGMDYIVDIIDIWH